MMTRFVHIADSSPPVVVKLGDDVQIPYEDGAERYLVPLLGDSWQALLLQSPLSRSTGSSRP